MTLREHGWLINFRFLVLGMGVYNWLIGFFSSDHAVITHRLGCAILWFMFGLGLQFWQSPRLDRDIKRVRDEIEAGDYSEPV